MIDDFIPKITHVDITPEVIESCMAYCAKGSRNKKNTKHEKQCWLDILLYLKKASDIYFKEQEDDDALLADLLQKFA